MRPRFAALARTAITLGGLFAAAPVSAADPVPSLDLRNFEPPVDPAGFLYLEPASTPGPWNWNFGAYGSYAVSPVVLEGANGQEKKAISHQVSFDYFANVGIGKRLALGLTIPTVVYQTGDDVRALLPGSAALPHTAFGDLTAVAKGTIVSPSDLGGLGIAMIGRLSAPTGDANSYVSEHSVKGELRALGELDLLAIAVRATAGVRLRAAHETLLQNGTDDYRFGNDLPWGVGVTLRPQIFGIDRGGHFRFTAEAHGAIALTPTFAAKPESPALFGLSARYTAGDVSALFGVELPLNDAVGNPAVRPVLAIGWAPRFADADGDGIADEDDQCAELAEDKDGFEDQDGCPDFDNDDDGVPDEDDKCPTAKEDIDDFQDEDGCPDPDNDGDGIPDGKDACPNDKGPRDGPKPGCPDPDPDHDGVLGAMDKCPDQPEDLDGFQDEDGCPDPDNDGDGIPDDKDACPNDKGEANAAAELNGCPNVDHDGDTIDDSSDKCPNDAEDYDGVEDEDGCPDAKGGAPLVTIEERKDERIVKFRVAPRFANDDVDPKTLASLRGLAVVLNHHPDWIVAVGVRPEGHAAAAEQLALNRAFAVALTLRWLTHRDGAAETVGWAAVRDLPGADATGLGILVLGPHPGVNPPEPAAR
jgi:hypothetical protein